MDVTFNKIWECVHFNFRYTQNRTFCLLFNRPKFLSLTLYSRSIDMRQNLHFQCDTDFSLRTLHIKTIPYGCITVSIPNECFDKPYRNARHAINSLKRLFCTQLISTWLKLFFLPHKRVRARSLKRYGRFFLCHGDNVPNYAQAHPLLALKWMDFLRRRRRQSTIFVTQHSQSTL